MYHKNPTTIRSISSEALLVIWWGLFTALPSCLLPGPAGSHLLQVQRPLNLPSTGARRAGSGRLQPPKGRRHPLLPRPGPVAGPRESGLQRTGGVTHQDDQDIGHSLHGSSRLVRSEEGAGHLGQVSGKYIPHLRPCRVGTWYCQCRHLRPLPRPGAARSRA